MKNMKPSYRNAYRIYVVLCIGIGIFCQYGKARPDYLLGGFYGLIGSWIGPGIVAKGLAHLSGVGEIGVPVLLGISAAFWLLFFKLAKLSHRDSAARPKPGRGLMVADPSRFDVLPNLPPGYGYYNRPEARTTRTTTYMDEEG